MNHATIDIGTNTTLLLVARTEPEVEAIEERAEITRLGRGIGLQGALGVEGIARTLDVLRDYAARARAHGAAITAVGTEALRRAPNAAAFLEPAAEILGVPVQVIDGAREAALTFRATQASFPEASRRGPVVVVDIGGGSTEIVIADGILRYDTSVPLGSVRLTERFIKRDPASASELAALQREVEGALTAVPWPDGGATVIGVAGTVTSLAAMAQHLASYDPMRVHGYQLTRAALEAEVARLAASSQADRERIIGLDPRRADVILAGAVILVSIARAASVDRVLVSDRGIRWGLLYELLDPPRDGKAGRAGRR